MSEQRDKLCVSGEPRFTRSRICRRRACFQCGGTTLEQNLEQFASADPAIDFNRRRIDQKQDQNPDVNRDKFIPGKLRGNVMIECLRRVTMEEKFDKDLQ